MLLIISAVFLFPVSQISTLVSIRHYFAIYLHLLCFFYFRFSVCFPGSFISNLSCHLGKVFQSFNHLWKRFLWLCQICACDALIIIEFQVYCIFTVDLRYIHRRSNVLTPFVCVQLGVLVALACPSLCDPMDCSLPGSSIHEILQAGILEWVAISYGVF